MARDGHADLLDALAAIPVESCSYTEWVNVGMALKKCGYDLSDWQSWSATDTRTDRDGRPYYSERACASKWRGFDNSRVDAVSSGTIVHMAEGNGWVQPSRRTYGWDDRVPTSDGPSLPSYSAKTLDLSEVGEEPFDRGAPEDATGEFLRYLRALFHYDEHVAVVTRTRNGHPSGTGRCDLTREGIEELVAKGGMDSLGVNTEDGGAFCCINPVDGEGRADRNVADYRYALVESDLIGNPDKQLALIHEMRLPCAAITWSGNKSVHAVVHIDAKDRNEYRERVAELYKHLRKNGFATDEQNKNPSRLTRCPGVRRGDGWQRLIEDAYQDGHDGFTSWDEWQDWLVQEMTKLPEIETFSKVGELPPLADPIVEGVLRRCQKMLVVGPSKAGKSFLMIELGIAIAEGWEWFSHRCRKGRVLIINFEIQRASMLHRIHDVWRKMAEAHDVDRLSTDNLDVWNLRGHGRALDKLTPMLVRQAASGNYDMIIIDPIYKVLTGDENSASDMAAFCNEFDKISEQLECAVTYCHHHAKGAAGRRASMDRASGSGVFTRDPDAFLDMSPIQVGESSRDLLLYEGDDGYQMQANPFRVSYTLREFATPAPTDVLFKWPVHEVTEDLHGFAIVGEPGSASSGGKRSGEARQRESAERFKRVVELVQEAMDGIDGFEGRKTPRVIHKWLMDAHPEETEELGITVNNLQREWSVKDKYSNVFPWKHGPHSGNRPSELVPR